MKNLFTINGSTLIEVLLAVGIVSAIGTVLIPSYRNYQIRSDMYLAKEQTEQGLNRATFLSQTAEQDGTWGFRADTGTVFFGESYDERDSSFDEHIAVPDSVSVSGLVEVTFSKLYGEPSAEGEIIVTSLLGDQTTINITKDSVLIAARSSSSQSSLASSSSSSSSSSDSSDSSGDDDDDDDDDDDCRWWWFWCWLFGDDDDDN